MKDEFSFDGIGGWYLRKSSPQQDIDSQRSAVGDWLAKKKIEVKFKLEETGERSEHKTRLKFQEALQLAKDGRLKWLVVDECSRIMTDSTLRTMAYLNDFREAGCRIYSIKENLCITDDDDEVAMILTTLAANKTAQEPRGLSYRVGRGMVENASKGRYMGGPVPYGFHLVCLAPDGKEKWRLAYLSRGCKLKINPDGTKQSYKQIRDTDGKVVSNTIGKDAEDMLVVRPAGKDELRVIKTIFSTYVNESISMAAIGERLNELEITCRGEPWDSNRIRSVLQSSYPVGFATWNKSRQGKYYEILNGQRVIKDAKNKAYQRAKEHWIKSNELFDPVIEPKLWQRAQDKLESHLTRQAPTSAKLWLAGILYCAGCGRMMRGNAKESPSLKKGVYAKYVHHPEYFCSSYVDRKKLERKGETCNCKRNCISSPVIETVLEKWLQESNQALVLLTTPPDMSLLNPKEKSATDATNEYLKSIGKMVRKLSESGVINEDAIAETFMNEGIKSDHGELLATLCQWTLNQSLPEKKKKLAELEKSHDELTEKVLNLNPSAKMALQRANEKLIGIESEIEETKKSLEDASVEYTQRKEIFVETHQALSKAQEALARGGDHLRKKAESIRSIVERINLNFQGDSVAIDIIPRNSPAATYSVKKRKTLLKISDRGASRLNESDNGEGVLKISDRGGSPDTS